MSWAEGPRGPGPDRVGISGLPKGLQEWPREEKQLGQRPGVQRLRAAPWGMSHNPQPHAREFQRADPDLKHHLGLGERPAAPPPPLGSQPCLPRKALTPAHTSAAKACLNVPGITLDLFQQESLATERLSEISRKRPRLRLLCSWGPLGHPPLGTRDSVLQA